MGVKMRACSRRGRWKVLSAAKSPNKGRVQEEFLQPPSLVRRTSKQFFPHLKSFHELNPSAFFSFPHAKGGSRYSRARTQDFFSASSPCQSCSQDFCVSHFVFFLMFFLHCISTYMACCLYFFPSLFTASSF